MVKPSNFSHMCILVALSIYAAVLTEQTAKLFQKTVLYYLIGNTKDNKTIQLFIFTYISLSILCRSTPSNFRRIESHCRKKHGTNRTNLMGGLNIYVIMLACD